ncbi:hypothetical protein NMY22_g13541 [Coprinellus aureogranulatus]|nr:hypothetical protein NMY22_g13541 [Coprinellus aureogranulatus]
MRPRPRTRTRINFKFHFAYPLPGMPLYTPYPYSVPKIQTKLSQEPILDVMSAKASRLMKRPSQVWRPHREFAQSCAFEIAVRHVARRIPSCWFALLMFCLFAWASTLRQAKADHSLATYAWYCLPYGEPSPESGGVSLVPVESRLLMVRLESESTPEAGDQALQILGS